MRRGPASPPLLCFLPVFVLSFFLAPGPFLAPTLVSAPSLTLALPHQLWPPVKKIAHLLQQARFVLSDMPSEVSGWAMCLMSRGNASFGVRMAVVHWLWEAIALSSEEPVGMRRARSPSIYGHCTGVDWVLKGWAERHNEVFGNPGL